MNKTDKKLIALLEYLNRQTGLFSKGIPNEVKTNLRVVSQAVEDGFVNREYNGGYRLSRTGGRLLGKIRLEQQVSAAGPEDVQTEAPKTKTPAQSAGPEIKEKK